MVTETFSLRTPRTTAVATRSGVMRGSLEARTTELAGWQWCVPAARNTQTEGGRQFGCHRFRARKPCHSPTSEQQNFSPKKGMKKGKE